MSRNSYCLEQGANEKNDVQQNPQNAMCKVKPLNRATVGNYDL